MSKNDTKDDLTSLPDVIAVSEAHRASSEITATSGEKTDSFDYQKLPGESLAEDETTSSLSPETTSSDLSNVENTPEKSRDASTASPPKDASSNVEDTVAKQMAKVCLAVTEIAASVVSEDNEDASGDLGNALVSDSAVAGTSGESTAQGAVAGDSENSIEHSGESVNRGCCPEHRGLIGYFRISMMYLRESKYLLPFQFLLLSMPVSSGFMGAKYMEKCPVSSAIPLLFFMMGILGTVVVCARIYSIFKKALFPHSDWSGQVRSALVASLLLLIVLYITELACFFNAKPSFSHGSDDYCDETFYTFVSYMTYISIALFILLLLLHCPGTRPCAVITSPQLFGEFD